MISFLNSRFLSYGVVVTAIFLFLGFGMYHLTQFETADEHYWLYERIPAYWKAWQEGKYKATFINDKPGVSLAIVSGIGLLQYSDPASHMKAGTGGEPDRFDVAETENLNRAFRLPLLLLNAALLPFFFWLFRIISNRWIAAYGIIGMALSPVLIGISQIVNPDALLWSFGGISLFSFLALLKTGRYRFVLLTGIALGLAMLSKYVANILPIFFFAVLLAFLVLTVARSNRDQFRAFLFQQIAFFVVIVFLAVLTLSVALPAVFVKPARLYELTIGFPLMKEVCVSVLLLLILAFLDGLFLKSRVLLFVSRFFQESFLAKLISFVAIGVFGILIIGRNFFSDWGIFNVPFDLKNVSGAWRYAETDWFDVLLLQFNPFVFSLPVFIIALLLFLWFHEIFSRKKDEYSFLVFTLTSFFFVYLSASTFSNTLSTVRYGILLYPVAAFLSGIGMFRLSGMFSDRTRGYAQPTLGIVSVCALGIAVFLSAPFYFNFTNILLPKEKIITDAWGYGGYEAAEYLNSLPNAQQLTIWSDYFGVCEFFVGTCFTDYKPKKSYMMDYYVLSHRGEIRYIPDHVRWTLEDTGDRKRIHAAEYYRDATPEWLLEIGGRPENFVKIVAGKGE